MAFGINYLPKLKGSRLLGLLSWSISVGLVLAQWGYSDEYLSPDHERILEVQLQDGTLLKDGLLAYEQNGTWLLPLSELTQALGFSIEVLAHEGKASGYFLQETRRFQLDLKPCKVEHDSKIEIIPIKGLGCEGIVPASEEIYIEPRHFESWFPVNFSINPFRQKLTITTREKIPIELQKERERESERLASSTEFFDPGYDREPSTESLFQGPFFDQQITIQHNQSGETRSDTVLLDSQVSAHLLGLEFQGQGGGSEKNLSAWQMHFGKHDLNGSLLGPLQATEFQIFDVNFSPMPLISLGKIRRGISISNYPLGISHNFGKQEFQGELLPGWEVELYHNGILLKRSLSDETKRYLFAEIPLYYGRNEFKFIFYGPNGQRREEQKTYLIDSNATRTDSKNYRVAASLNQGQTFYAGQFDLGLFRKATLRGGVANIDWQENSTPKHYAYIGANGAIGPILLSELTVFSDSAARAYQFELQAPIFQSSFDISYVGLSDFRSEIFNSSAGLLKTSQTQANLFFPRLGPLPITTTWQLTQDQFENHLTLFSVTQRLAINIGKIYFTNELQAPLTDISGFGGKLSAYYFPSILQFRLGATYDRKNIYGIETEVQGRFTDRYSASLGTEHQFQSHLTRGTARISKQFESLMAGISTTVDTNSDYSLAVVLNSSLSYQPQQEKIYMNSDPQTQYGSALVSVFLDTNENGIRDPGENPFPGIHLKIGKKDSDWITDQNGRVYLQHLAPYSPVDVSISLRSLDNPLLEPSKKGVRFFPSPGHVQYVDLPVVAIGEIDGSVSTEDAAQSNYLRGLEVQLLEHASHRKVQSAIIDPDGFFWLHSVKPGEYEIQLDPKALETRRLHSNPARRTVKIPETGSVESGQDFKLGKY